MLDEPVEVAERPGAVDLPRAWRPGRRPRLVRLRRRRRRSCADVDLTIPAGERLALVGPDRRREVHPGQAARPALRPGRGPGHVRPASTCATPRCASLRRPHRGGPAGGLPLRRHHPRQRAHRPRQRPPTPRSRPPSRPSGCSTGSPRLPDGLETEVRERGSRLSAGEKQLVSLARAALADPAVLVLDEATSSLDPGTEALVEQAMDRLMAGRTVIVIAHRLSTAERADRVGVVDAGGLAELGTHADLVVRYAGAVRHVVERVTEAAPAAVAVRSSHRHVWRPLRPRGRRGRSRGGRRRRASAWRRGSPGRRRSRGRGARRAAPPARRPRRSPRG